MTAGRRANGATRYYTTGDLSRLCGCAPRTISKWGDSGMLPCFRLPGSTDRRFQRRDVAAFLRQHGMTEALAKLGRPLLCCGLPEGETLCATFDGEAVADWFGAGTRLAVGAYDVAVLDAALGRTDCLALPVRLTRVARLALVGVLSEDDGDAGAWITAGYRMTLRRPLAPGELAAAVALALREG